MTYKVFKVPRAGIEPARIASLVFETNASTNSAIWALTLQNTEAKCMGFCVLRVQR